MLKVRVMPTLLFKELGLVKGVGFDSWRRVGAVMQSVKVYNVREVDELVFLDISATPSSGTPDYATIDDIADECFMPLAVGGGIRSIDDVRKLLLVGADKVVINTAAVENPALISQVAERFGAQCVVVSIDAKKVGARYEAFTHSGTKPTGRDPVDLARQAESGGAGEILITSIERDGTLEGYDLDLIKRISAAVRVPVIASGGAGSYDHMVQALAQGKASAVAAASMFHFTEQTPLGAKRHLAKAGFPVRYHERA
jgi:imidazole glycerol-phosphate synthase subunit HisF